MKRFTNALLFMMACLVCLPLTSYGANHTTTREARQAYLEKVDVDYAYKVTKSLEEFKTNEKLGYRTAGSPAEIATAKKLFEEMKRIGLVDVKMEEFTLDSWEFTKAELSFTTADGVKHTAVLAGYPTTFNTKGKKSFKVVYAGRGTANDFKDLDVKGKLVLIDINQRADWWINYPAMQAKIKGAAAVIAMQNGGYAEISPDALNTQDMCGPADTPAFSISQTDAGKLKAALEKAGGTLKVSFDAKSIVTPNAKAYNVHGKIIGKDQDALVLLSAHMDSYFSGFQDDNAAIGLMMGIAKGIVDSGYKPEKTIVFNALAAEEWGVTNSRYDWSTGAYNQIFRLHPEWVGKAIVDMNFEMPAYQHETADKIRVVQEYNPFLTEFSKTIPRIPDAYPDGIAVISPVRTWSDDFSFAIAGVPSMRNDFEAGEFRVKYYHSNFDNEDTYNRNVFRHHLVLYGLMTLDYDRVAVAPLDFSVRLKELKASLKDKGFTALHKDGRAMMTKLDATINEASKLAAKTTKLNADYRAALDKGDTTKAEAIFAATRELNKSLLASFKLVQDAFVRLTWEDEPIFEHAHAVTNLTNLHKAIKALQAGDVALTLDEILSSIDNNYYTYHFDKEVYDYFTDYTLNQPADRLMWGAGRIVGYENLYSTVQSLKAKREAQTPDLQEEIATLQGAVERHNAMLAKALQNEEAALVKLHEQFKEALTLARIGSSK